MNASLCSLSRRSFLSVAGTGILAAAPRRVAVPPEYPLYRAAGSHREMGRQHGEQAAEKIKGHLERIAAAERVSRDKPIRPRPVARLISDAP